MIRINLLYDVGGGTPDIRGRSAKSSAGSTVSRILGKTASPDNSDILAKLLILFLPFVALYGYQKYDEFTSKILIEKLKTRKEAVDSKLIALAPAVREIEQFQQEKQLLDSQLEVIKHLSKERLKNVKSLDAMQSLIPQRAWLASLKILENKVELEGYSTDDLVISEFMQSLEASIYYANVALVSSEEFKKDTVIVKKFIIRCYLENL